MNNKIGIETNNKNDDDDDLIFLKPKKNSKAKSNTKMNNVNTKNMISEFINQDIQNNNKPKEKTLSKEFPANAFKGGIEARTKNEIKNDKNKKEIKPNLKINYSYIRIDKSNKFSKMTEEDYKSFNEVLSSFKETKEKIDLINSIFIKFLDRLCPNCDGDPMNISKYLSKEIFKNKKIHKDNIENILNYFFNFRYELLYSTNFFLSKKTMKYLGYILCYSFSKFNKFSIRDGNHFLQLLKKTLDKRQDALIDYYNYISGIEEGDLAEKYKKMIFWKNNRNNYLFPPELNFLINRFIKIKSIDIELDLQGEPVTENDFNVISLLLLNLNILFVNLSQFKINFINQRFQYDICNGYFRDLISSVNKNKNIIKKNSITNPEFIYDKKWNFEYKFNLDYYRITGEEFKKDNLIFDEYNQLYINKQKKEIKAEQMLNSTIEKRASLQKSLNLKKNESSPLTNFMRQFTIVTPITTKESNSNFIFDSIYKIKHVLNLEKNTKNPLITDKNNYVNIIRNNTDILNLIAMIVCSMGRFSIIKSLKTVDIVMNDSYNTEFITNLVNTYDIDEELFDFNFHILDFIYNKLKQMEHLNIEINSLDLLTFNKVLNLIYKNQKLLSLNLSFFSSDMTYFRRSLLKLFNQTIGGLEDLINYNDTKIDEIILNSLLPFFIENLSVLFTILKSYTKLENLGFNFDLPIILINQQNYTIPIIKFILNILFLVDNNNYSINTLTILGPSICFDERILPGINDTFSKFDINNNNQNLIELNLQIQLYNIINIKNIISSNLIILNIGNLDFITFKHLVKYLTSYNFSIKSNLEKLGIRLNTSISLLSTELKLTLRELFYIKISNLSELKIYSNIFIKYESDYKFLIQILKDNWIPDYTILLNPLSNKVLEKSSNLIKDVSYFESDKNYDIIFWYLIYIFKIRYRNHLLNFASIKTCINFIFSFLFSKKNIKLNHSLESTFNKQDKK